MEKYATDNIQFVAQPHYYPPAISKTLVYIFTQVSITITNVYSSAVYNLSLLGWPYTPPSIVQLGRAYETATPLRLGKC